MKSITQHPKFDRDSWIDYDFAVLEMSRKIPNSPLMKPIKLPRRNAEVAVGLTVQITGWGATSKSDTGNLLRRATLKRVLQANCKAAYPSVNVTNSMICAAVPEGGKGICFGDSGGPLAKNNIIYGVTSWSRGCAVKNYPDVFAKVSVVVDWIKLVMNLK